MWWSRSPGTLVLEPEGVDAMSWKDRSCGGGYTVPAQRRSETSALKHRIVAARASAVVLEREGLHERAAQMRAEADLLERGELSG